MKLEILLATVENLKCAITVFSIGTLTVLTIYGLYILMEYDMEDDVKNKKLKSLSKKMIAAGVVALIINIIPSIEELWKVRIGLIKLELSSPENLTKATETIERIGAKLECKYLGCKEEKKP